MPRLLGTALIAALVASTPSLAEDPPVPPLAISKETTWITEPLRSDGTPDYPAWLTRKFAAGVTPDNNAAVVLSQIRMTDDVRNPGVRMFCADSSGRLAEAAKGAASSIGDGLCAPGTTTLVARTGP